MVNAISVDKIREFVRKRQGEKTGNAAINRSPALLRRMFKIAKLDGKIQFIPPIKLLKEPPARKGFLAQTKFETLLGKLPVHLRPLITFLYYCGVRVGEAVQIQWNQADLEHAFIRLEGEQTKTSEARVVPLPDVLMSALKNVKKTRGVVFDATGLREHWTKATGAPTIGHIGSRLA